MFRVTCLTLLYSSGDIFPSSIQSFPAFPTDCQFALAAAVRIVIDFSFKRVHYLIFFQAQTL